MSDSDLDFVEDSEAYPELNIIGGSKGMVLGKLKFKDNGHMIDCSKMGHAGKGIPPNIHGVTDISSDDALFILLVEKDSAFFQLAKTELYNQYPCIIIASKEKPDVATRFFMKKLQEELELPLFALLDCNPDSIKILSVCGCGPDHRPYMGIPCVKWIGIRPSDMDKYKIPEDCRLDMSDQEVKACKDLLKDEFVRKNVDWVKELNLMIKMKKKMEVGVFVRYRADYLTNVYIPHQFTTLNFKSR